MPDTRTTALAAALRGFFTEDLPRVRGLSRQTVLAYRDALKLLLRYLTARHGRAATALDFPDLAPDALLAFLADLETERGNSAATRNARLAALHAFARYAAAHHPEHLALCQRILAIPFMRTDQRLVEYLDADELRALLQAPGAVAHGRRDYTLLLALYNTGARVQEILDLRPCELQLEPPWQALLHGKGGKQRWCPLWPETVQALQALLDDTGRSPADSDPLFRNRHGQPLALRRALHPTQARSRGGRHRPLLGRQAPAPARAAAHRGHALAAGAGRSGDDQPLARSRESHHDRPVLGGRPRSQAHRRAAGSTSRDCGDPVRNLADGHRRPRLSRVAVTTPATE